MNICCNKCDCDPCKKQCCEPVCGCPTQIMGITTVHDDTPAWLRYNFGGKSIDYDFDPVVKFAETDTSVRLDIPGRALVYNAEKHTDSFSAQELGSMFHVSDLGDVDITGVTDNSLFVYQKDSDCGEGCEGINNSWIAWNANDSTSLVDKIDKLMGFNADGKPKALNRPTNTTQYYNLGWNGANKVSYVQPTEANIVSGSSAHLLFEDPTTKQQMYMKVKVTIAGDGTITLKRES